MGEGLSGRKTLGDEISCEERDLTQEVFTRTAISVCSGVMAGSLAAPFIAIADKAITSNASGREPMWSAMRSGYSALARDPITFVRQPAFRWIAFVYGCTYVAANLTVQACESLEHPWQYPKFITTSITNVSLSILKDRAFAQMFSRKGSSASVSFPRRSLVLFGLRDASTIVASFNLPPLLAPHLEELTGLSPLASRSIAQLLTPLAMQGISVPMHLHALDLYNRPIVRDAKEASRLHFVRQEYFKTVAGRWARILPAFGIAGVVNNELIRFFTG